jgi:hypothetical protein
MVSIKDKGKGKMDTILLQASRGRTMITDTSVIECRKENIPTTSMFVTTHSSAGVKVISKSIASDRS